MDDLVRSTNRFGMGNSDLTLDIENFCAEALHIPIHTLSHWTSPFDYDAYLVHNTEGYSFAISGPQLHAWKHRERM